MNPDGTVTIGSPLTLRPAVTPTIQPPNSRMISGDVRQTQIRVVNPTGSDRSLSPESFRILFPRQQQFDGGSKARLLDPIAELKGPAKAITLSQAQEMGILSEGQPLFYLLL